MDCFISVQSIGGIRNLVWKLLIKFSWLEFSATSQDELLDIERFNKDLNNNIQNKIHKSPKALVRLHEDNGSFQLKKGVR